ncbi:hypothetical protein [Cryptosporangium minutisporangium]|uniref:Uncharacterized protein n=1 Tax=Cryptosporangium minutisporangium TaxID=113569 RepID=A0ABP6SVL6_9ACTN
MHIEAGGVTFSAGSTPDIDNVYVYLAARGGGVQWGGKLPDSVPTERPNPTSEPGPTIRGAKSTWWPNGDHTFAAYAGHFGQLDFVWAEGARAIVVIKDLPDGRNTAIRIVESLGVQLGVPTGVPFTFAKPKVPLLRIDITHWNKVGSAFRLFFWERRGIGPGVQIDVATNPAAGLTLETPLEDIGPYQVEHRPIMQTGFETFRFAPRKDVLVAMESRPEGSVATNSVPAAQLASRTIKSFELTGDLQDPSTWKS